MSDAESGGPGDPDPTDGTDASADAPDEPRGTPDPPAGAPDGPADTPDDPTGATDGPAGAPFGRAGSEYTPDELLDLPGGVTFTGLLVGVVLAAAAVDLLRVGLDASPVPYDYQFPFGVVYLIASVVVLERMYGKYDMVRDEFVRLSAQPSTVGAVEEYRTGPGEIDDEIRTILDLAFHPAVLLGGALVSGLFNFGVVYRLGVLWAYPHVLTDFLYGAAHGLYYGPLGAGVLVVYRSSSRYIVDIDILAPDGVGGYRTVGDAMVSVVTYAILLVTLDFVVLSSVSFVGRPLFQRAALGLYVAMILLFLSLVVYAVLSIRRRLLDIRDRKIEVLRARFNRREATFWEKVEADEDASTEAVEIATMYRMFEGLNRMGLWPLNLYSAAKLVASLSTSVAVALVRTGVLTVPG